MKLDARRLAAALAVLALLTTACQGGNSEGPNANASGESPEPPERCLSGEDLPSGTKAGRPAVAVKIENSPEARPQEGLEKADLVYEEIVEGAVTRFMAIYHCGTSDKTGPVRSARFDDANLATPFTKVLAYSGSNDIVEEELRKRRMIALDEDVAGEGLYRDPPGSTGVHSLFAHTEKLRRLASKSGADSPTAEPFLFGDVPSDAQDAKRVTLHFHPSSTIAYRYKGDSWKRFEGGEPFMTAAGSQLGVTNVLVQEVRVEKFKGIVDSTGTASPDIYVKGKGRALLFRDGKVIKGTWTVKEPGKAPVFETNEGEVMTFAIGSIWIELVPSARGVVKGSFSFK